jgi:translation elongation factor EF-4
VRFLAGPRQAADGERRFVMRDLFAALVALALLVTAASLATTLQMYRRRRGRARDSERALGRTIIAEIPDADDLALFSEDASRFYYGDRSIDKDLIVAVRVLINGAPIAACVSRRHPESADRQATSFEDRPEGIARDRWDVAIEAVTGTTLVQCGAIRERVSQELARGVFDAVKRDLERRDAK